MKLQAPQWIFMHRTYNNNKTTLSYTQHKSTNIPKFHDTSKTKILMCSFVDTTANINFVVRTTKIKI